MVGKLVLQVAEFESALQQVKDEYHKPLANFTSADYMMLNEFLKTCRVEQDFANKYVDNGIILEQPNTYVQLKEQIDMQRKSSTQFVSMFGSMQMPGDPAELGPELEGLVRDFFYMPIALTKINSTHFMFYESILAATKKIAEEKLVSVLDVSRDRDLVDEIYKTVFTSKREFEAYHNSLGEAVVTIVGTMYGLVDAAKPYIDEMVKQPLVGGILGMNYHAAMTSLPDLEKIKGFEEDQKNYVSKVADRIYGKNPAYQKIFVVEVDEVGQANT